MSERVETGGLMSFNYAKGKGPKISKSQKKDIADAYRNYYARKRSEMKIKILRWGLASLFVLLVVGVIFIRQS